MNKHTSIAIAVRIWFFTSLTLIISWPLWFLSQGKDTMAADGLLIGIIGAIVSSPVIIVLAIVLPFIKKSGLNKLAALCITCLAIAFFYAFLLAIVFGGSGMAYANRHLLYTALLFGYSLTAICISHKAIDRYFFTGTRSLLQNNKWQQNSVTQINTNMETFNEQQHNDILLGTAQTVTPSSNKTLIKAITTAVLILAMMIPATFVSNLVMERQTNQTAALNRIDANAATQQEKNFALLHTHENNIKTMRATKYAILVIGLTFALFFIIELVQKNPMHPVQYILVGLGLVIFYTLLLSISEFIQFDTAYLIAALATLTLIVLYVKSHFKNWQAAGALGGVLTGLYAFIFVIISLEDAALLVGSIGLFIVLAIIMYTTRNINWYNPSLARETRK